MTTGTAQDKLRQIAILVASVDAAAARQILLHLPTDKARRVRELASQLGQVRPEEKRKILAEFQRTAAAAPQRRPSPPAESAAELSYDAALTKEFGSSSATAVLPEHQQAAIDALWPQPADQSTEHSWRRLSAPALAKFVRDERPAVAAVVISQLSATVAAEVLQLLPRELVREVLLRLSRLQEIDPEAMQAIDEHLAQRLGEYQHFIASELENTRRLQALLAAAPSEVRHSWSAILASDRQSVSATAVVGPQSEFSSQAPPATRAVPPNMAPLQQTVQPATPAAGGQWGATTADVFEPSLDASASLPQPATVQPRGLTTVEEGGPDILPFPSAASSEDTVDRSLVQIEFEQILDLPPRVLAEVLSHSDSRDVLLALAGATPQFMKRFMHMLDRRDAKVLQQRVQQIGPIRLREVDDAQRRIVENAARLSGQSDKQQRPRRFQAAA